MVQTKLRPYEVWEAPTGHQKVRARLSLNARFALALPPWQIDRPPSHSNPRNTSPPINQ